MGATGGGYILGRGAVSAATATRGTARRLSIVVNGDPRFDARTTRKALELLLQADPLEFGTLSVSQRVEVPIGFGFGSSAASSLSAVLAAAAALGMRFPTRRLAYFAHAAEIVSGTGLGTVSVAFNATGAGVITKAGAPGLARFLRVSVPRGTRLVAACVATMKKSVVLSSRERTALADRLGDEALSQVLADPTLDALASAGERFSERLGLMTKETRKLAEAAKRAGAAHASQNMIGQAVHAVVDEDSQAKVAAALASLVGGASVYLLEPGRKRAGLLPSPR